MTSSRQDAPVAVDKATGEVIDLDTVNSELIALNQALAAQAPEMSRLLAEQKRVGLRFQLEFAAAVKASTAGAADQRKADALLHVSTVVLDDSPVDLLTRKEELEVRLRAMRDLGHDLRARMSSLQSVANNLRTEANLLRYGP